MEYLAQTAISLSALLTLPIAQLILNLLVKSTILVALTLIVAQLLRSRLSKQGLHLLWLNCLLCIAVLPFAGEVANSLASSLTGQQIAGITIVNINAAESSTFVSAGLNTSLAVIYLIVTCLLLLRLVLSAAALRKISRNATEAVSKELVMPLRNGVERLSITRNVRLLLCDQIHSPMSFGIAHPTVILPAAAKNWNESTLEDVFLHELSHIKRLDWPTMLFCHLLVSMFWINPLVWFAMKRLNEAAEQACDSTVIAYNKNGENYAEDLLRLARSSRGERAPMLAQLMFEQHSLSNRIRNILEGSKMPSKLSKTFLSAIFVFTSVSIVSLGSFSVLGASANQSDQDYVPISAEPPLYPSFAAEEGIEGWILVSFTVTVEGAIDGSSLQIVDAEPMDVFNNSAFRAAREFLFEPRVVDGKAVAVPGVQYLFKYVLSDETDLDELGRPPPPARESRL